MIDSRLTPAWAPWYKTRCSVGDWVEKGDQGAEERKHGVRGFQHEKKKKKSIYMKNKKNW